MHAIILAAGMGKRLGAEVPKPLSPIGDGRTLLGNQVDILSRLIGRDRIVLVLGHAASQIMAAHPDLAYVLNPRYAQTNTAKSLLAGLRKLEGDVLWLNGDVFFEQAVVEHLLAMHPGDSRLLVNTARTADEEIKYTLNADGSVAQLSKQVRGALGESLGLQIIKDKDRPTFLAALEQVADQDYFEKALENCTLGGKLRLLTVDVGDRYCREVDFPEDLAAVKAYVKGQKPRAEGQGAESPGGREAESGNLKSQISNLKSIQVGLYGVGSFGYAMLRHLAQRSPGELGLRAFDRNDDVRRTLRDRRFHPYHEARSPLAEHVRVVDSVAELMDGLDVLVLAVTSDSTREVMGNVKAQKWSTRGHPLRIINTAKALDHQTGDRLSTVIATVMAGDNRPYVYAMLAGGTIANELLLQDPLGMTLACEDEKVLAELKQLFASPTMWVQTTLDLPGVELAGALKNVIAICAGMARGLELPYGSVTHLISRMASEVEDFCVKRMAAARDTFRLGSQCWGSDLWMSCIGPTRNARFGELLGKGQSLDEAAAQMQQGHLTIEGVRTLKALDKLVSQHPQELRLLSAARQVILHAAPASTLIEALMDGR